MSFFAPRLTQVVEILIHVAATRVDRLKPDAGRQLMINRANRRLAGDVGLRARGMRGGP